MRRQIIYTTILVLAAAGQQVAAQSKEGLNRPSAQENAVFRSYVSSPADLLFNPQSMLNRVQLEGVYESGDFRLPQQADRIRGLKASTEGQTVLKNIHLYGAFSYRRQWQDSVSWTQRLDPLSANPYYIATERAGSLQTADYHLSGKAATTINDHLLVGLGINYQVGDAARDVMPVAGHSNYLLGFEANLGWKFSSKAGAAFKGQYGYGYEKTTVDFSAAQDQADKDLQFYNMLGYGTVSFAPNKFMHRHFNYYGGGLNAWYQSGPNDFRIEAGYKYQRDSTRQSAKSGDVAYMAVGKYFSTDLSARFTWLRSLPGNRKAMLQLEGLNTKGHDQNDSLGGNNYRYQKHFYTATLSLYRYKSAMVKNGWLGNIAFTDFQKLDGATEHTFQASYIEGYIQREQAFPVNELNAVTAMLRAGGRADVGSKLHVPASQMNFFTRNIALPEVRYYQESALTAAARIGWLHQLKSSAQAEFSLESGIMHAVNTNTPPAANAKFDPQGNRFYINCNLQFYF
ncbi:DUF6850 family outer membrane beta-barrel protein [Chitinophaga barathri]|uniref:DUF6850 domain-containing protein n=1 Tax=Chitinophaga barathri TaxID=1647451 RepID=A0A3N4M7X2_9BACT|nr:DUF6850 family outer membrane beta-barrel protein [Chitinophaga barathri]RPD39654.1 hypothetical protein EG028_18585 [Chitinophaga barathri]